ERNDDFGSGHNNLIGWPYVGAREVVLPPRQPRRQSGRAICPYGGWMPPSPAVQTRDEALRIVIRSGRQLDEAVRAAQGGEVPRPIRRPGHRPGSAPVIDLDLDWHEARMRGFDLDFAAECHALRRGRKLAHGREERGQRVSG